ncbi:myo-inosose-2 dehydratase [Consotaella salsifontis]|uniref:2-keto-myo-inositol dehydratase n=1 Tax=Consotaella salsifontis TaxID=1365950 RepID=A0A1T4RLS7_9HYPH|nr:myo-inosose-2 dehydratase [Consotaella salsifontis]SKA16950.1 2-keto-myo-inositol dehydratase [Consotaella salsifontis]
MIRIGANPICWSNDDMKEIGGNIPLEQCLSEASEIGLEGMELGNKFPKTASEMRAKLGQYGLVFVSGWLSTFLLERDAEAELEAQRPELAFRRDSGAEVLVTCECTRTVHGSIDVPLSRRPILTPDEWARLLPRMTRFAELVKQEYGLTLVYHHHMGTVVQSEADIDRFMTGTGEAVKLLLDTGHATWAGVDPVALAARYRDRIAHIHTKDVRLDVARKAAEGDWSFLKSVLEGVYTVPGDGAVDYVAFFRELPNYTGWVIIEAEQDPEKANPKKYVAMGYANLVRFLNEAGLRKTA